MTGGTLTPEEVERDLARAGPALEAAADELSDHGHLQAADIIRDIADVDDLDATNALVWARMEAAPETERDLVMYALYDTARVLQATGEERYGPSVLRLTEMVEQLGAVFGLPGEDDVGRGGRWT